MYQIVKTGIFMFCITMLTNNLAAQPIADKDIKMNITTIDSPLEKLTRLEPKVFEYDTGNFKSLQLPKGKQFGFMTDNVKEVFPGLVTVKNISYPAGKNSSRTARIPVISMENLIPILVASIKAQQAEIEKLKTSIEELKKIVNP